MASLINLTIRKDVVKGVQWHKLLFQIWSFETTCV